jgi:hypothetical protein
MRNSSRDLNERKGIKIGKRIFVLPCGRAFIESSLLSGETINPNPLRRLNEAYPKHSFHTLVTWLLRCVGVEAV